MFSNRQSAELWLVLARTRMCKTGANPAEGNPPWAGLGSQESEAAGPPSLLVAGNLGRTQGPSCLYTAMPMSVLQHIRARWGTGQTSLEGPSSPLRALYRSLTRNQAVVLPAISSSSEVYAQSAAQCARNIGPQIKAYKQTNKPPKQVSKQSGIKTPEHSVSALGFLLSFAVSYRIQNVFYKVWEREPTTQISRVIKVVCSVSLQTWAQ